MPFDSLQESSVMFTPDSITEIRFKLMDGDQRLRAFASMTVLNGLVIRDLKVVEGSAGGPFVTFPQRRLSDRCGKCGLKNHLTARFCNWCGVELGYAEQRAAKDPLTGKLILYADICHPVSASVRAAVQERVIRAYREEVELSRKPGYVDGYSRWRKDADEFAPGDVA